jgi:hypothetical protein
MRVGSRIGWIEVNNYGAFPSDAALNYFSLDSADSYVVSADFLTRILVADLLIDPLRGLLVRDLITPVDALRRIALTLEGYGTPSLGDELLLDPRVAADRDVLMILSNTPSAQWDYGDVREQAAALLSQLE